MLRLSAPVVLFERRRQCRREVDAQVIGKQDDDEQHITELIGDRAVGILRCTWLVAESEVQLAPEFTVLLRQPRVPRQRRSVMYALFDPGVDESLDLGEGGWNPAGVGPRSD